ncbi:hypothetical protein IPF37_01590 [bacterium]|nr:MAG: hypothetical protein IPF37_01590 [bacterium]
MKKVVLLAFAYCFMRGLLGDKIVEMETHFKVRPELDVFLKTGVSSQIVQTHECTRAICQQGIVSLSRDADINDVVVAVNSAYSLHFASLLDENDEQTIQQHMLYELLSKHYALSYLQSFSRSAQERYQELIGNESSLEKRLVIDFQQLINDNALAADKAALLGQYLLEKYDNISELQAPIKAAVLAAIDVLSLAIPAHILMTQGGDDRLFVSSQTGLNKYYTSSLPSVDVIMRSSCTSSSPSMHAYQRAEFMRRSLLKKALQSSTLEQCFDQAMESLRRQFKQYFHAQDSCIVTTPSGSDAEMIMTLAALARHPLWKSRAYVSGQPLVTTILTAAGEVGSLSYAGAMCTHLSDYLPSGGRVKIGTSLAGLPVGVVQGIKINARNQIDGSVSELRDVENQIEATLARVVGQENQIAVVHLVHFSKTGLSVPSFDFVKRMKNLYGKNLIVIVDAAQSRVDDTIIRTYLEAQFNVFITGSKFFAGPPFSGLVFLTPDEALEFQNQSSNIPAAFGDYFTKYDADSQLPALRDSFAQCCNYGLWLRLEATYAEMERFGALDCSVRDAVIGQWVGGVRSLIQQNNCTSLLDEKISDHTSCVVPLLGNINSVVVFLLSLSDGTELDFEALQRIHMWLTQDISQTLPDKATDQERAIAQQKILIGQPVKLTSVGRECAVLRIALSAPMISTMAQTPYLENVRAMLKQDKKIIQKLNVIVRNYSFLQDCLGSAEKK